MYTSMGTSLNCRAARTPQELTHSVSLHYLAEGAANVVFKIQKYDKNDAEHPPFVFAGSRIVHNAHIYLETVLRVSKGLEKTISAQEIKRHLEADIDPLFGRMANSSSSHDSFTDHMMNHWLVALDDSLVASLNAEYAKHSTRREGHIRPGTKGLVVEDMSSKPGHSLTIEIKPKWLAQSPNAPPAALRCRTCALRALKQARRKASNLYICPLQVLSGNTAIIAPFVEQKVAEAIAEHDQHPPPADKLALIVRSLVDYLATGGKGHALLALLAALQTRHDPCGVLGDAPERMQMHFADVVQRVHDLRLAMTLRDCSLFIRVNYRAESESQSESGSDSETERPRVEARLGDLDFKSASKLDDWKKKEEELLSGGWYGVRGEVGFTRGGCKIAEGMGAADQSSHCAAREKVDGTDEGAVLELVKKMRLGKN